MVEKLVKTLQINFLDTPLKRFIDLGHELCILSGQIDWDSIEKELSVYFFKDIQNLLHK